MLLLDSVFGSLATYRKDFFLPSSAIMRGKCSIVEAALVKELSGEIKFFLSSSSHPER